MLKGNLRFIGLVAEVEEQIEEATLIYSSISKEQVPLAEFSHGFLLWEQDRISAALAVWSNSPRKDMIGYRLCSFETGGGLISLDDRINLVQMGLTLAPDSVNVQKRCGRVYLDIGEKKAAANVYWRIAELTSDPQEAADWYIHSGDLFRGLLLWERALSAYKLARETAPNDHRSYMRIANLLFQQGRDQEAIEVYLTVIEKFSEHGWAYFNLAEIYAGLDDDRGAEYWYVQAIGREPKPGVGALYAGLIRFRQDDFIAAIEYFETATKWEPSECLYKLWLARGLRKTGAVTHSLETYLIATKCYSSNDELTIGHQEEVRAYLKETADTHREEPIWQKLYAILSE
jgi:tetratricopeptide (TPR) repeat protein